MTKATPAKADQVNKAKKAQKGVRRVRGRVVKVRAALACWLSWGRGGAGPRARGWRRVRPRCACAIALRCQ